MMDYCSFTHIYSLLCWECVHLLRTLLKYFVHLNGNASELQFAKVSSVSKFYHWTWVPSRCGDVSTATGSRDRNEAGIRLWLLSWLSASCSQNVGLGRGLMPKHTADVWGAWTPSALSWLQGGGSNLCPSQVNGGAVELQEAWILWGTDVPAAESVSVRHCSGWKWCRECFLLQSSSAPDPLRHIKPLNGDDCAVRGNVRRSGAPSCSSWLFLTPQLLVREQSFCSEQLEFLVHILNPVLSSWWIRTSKVLLWMGALPPELDYSINQGLPLWTVSNPNGWGGSLNVISQTSSGEHET